MRVDLPVAVPDLREPPSPRAVTDDFAVADSISSGETTTGGTMAGEKVTVTGCLAAPDAAATTTAHDPRLREEFHAYDVTAVRFDGVDQPTYRSPELAATPVAGRTSAGSCPVPPEGGLSGLSRRSVGGTAAG